MECLIQRTITYFGRDDAYGTSLNNAVQESTKLFVVSEQLYLQDGYLVFKLLAQIN